MSKELEHDKELDQALHRKMTQEESNLYSHIKNIIQYYVKNIYPSKFEAIKAKHKFAADDQIAIEEQLGSEELTIKKHGLTDSIHDSFNAELIWSNFTPKVIPLHTEKKKYSDDAQDWYDWMYHQSWFESNVSERLYSEASLLWDSYVYLWKRNVTINNKEMEFPHAEHISFFEMFLEPLASSFSDSRNKIVRTIRSSDDIIRKYKNVVDWDKDFNDEYTVKESITKTIGNAIYTTDFKKMHKIDFYERLYKDKLKSYLDDCWDDRYQAITNYYHTWQVYEDLFWFDSNSKLCEVIEVWQKQEWKYVMKLMVNGYILPMKKEVSSENCPFGVAFYEENVGSVIHRGIWEKLAERQQECDMLGFIINNGIKMHAFPDWITDAWVQDANSKNIRSLVWSGMQKVYKLNDQFDWRQPFQPIQYIEKDVLDMARIRLQETVNQAYADMGINSYTLWSDWRVERLNDAFQERIERSRARLKPIKSSVSKILNNSFYVWLEILSDEFSKNLIEEIDDDGVEHLRDLDLKNIKNGFNIVISSEWQREDTLKDAWQNILNIMNTFGEALWDKIDVEELAQWLAGSYGIEWVKFLNKEEKVDKFRSEMELQLEKAKIEQEFKEKMQELLPEQPQQTQEQDTIVPLNNQWEPINPEDLPPQLQQMVK